MASLHGCTLAIFFCSSEGTLAASLAYGGLSPQGLSVDSERGGGIRPGFHLGYDVGVKREACLMAEFIHPVVPRCFLAPLVFIRVYTLSTHP